MKIVELLDMAMKTGDIIYVSGWALGMRYNKDNDCFIWCNPCTGQFNKSRRDLTGLHRVILCGKILNQDKCMLVPLNKYKVGDKFRLSDIEKVVSGTNGHTFRERAIEPIGEIVEIITYEYEKAYVIKVNDNFATIVLDGDVLSKYLKLSE